jgi:hypothetical protein
VKLLNYWRLASLLFILAALLVWDSVRGRHARYTVTRVFHIGHIPTAEEAAIEPEVARALAIGRQYRGFTKESVRARYQVLQETNQVPSVLDMTCVDKGNGDEVMFSFENDVLYMVDVKRTNNTGYGIFLHKDGTVVGCEERFGASKVHIEFYDGERLESITHYMNEMWCGIRKTFSESGEIVSSNDYKRPVEPGYSWPARSSTGSRPR